MPIAEPILDAIDPDRLKDGVRAWGVALNLDRLVVHTGTKKVDVAAPASDPKTSRIARTPRPKALDSFCSFILNLNEFLYVD